MKYYIIAGEASGDLHGSNLMKSLLKEDKDAEFRFWGGDKMSEVGGKPVRHISELAFMGFAKVILNIRTIRANMKMCQRDILNYNPDVLILIDYGGFNMKIAEFAKANGVTVHYYIAPKIWASRPGRAKKIRETVDKILVILPFEVDFFQKHGCEVEYVGNPLLDAIDARENKDQTFEEFISVNNLSEKPKIAILAGSRKQEIKLMLPHMIEVAECFPEYEFVIAGAPAIEKEFYESFVEKAKLPVIYNQTYPLLQQSKAAMVTSGTATLETALFRVPEIVCYSSTFPDFVWKIGFKHFIKVDWLSLANLIVGREIVKELLQMKLTKEFLQQELNEILNNKEYRQRILSDYDELWDKMGTPGASDKTAKSILKSIKK